MARRGLLDSTPYKNFRQLSKAENRRNGLREEKQKKEWTNLLSNTKWSTLIICIWVTFYSLNRLYSSFYTLTGHSFTICNHCNQWLHSVSIYATADFNFLNSLLLNTSWSLPIKFSCARCGAASWQIWKQTFHNCSLCYSVTSRETETSA